MTTHRDLATRLLSDDVTRGIFMDVVYEMLKRDLAADMIARARGAA
jgi:type I restriction enzyme R subunit